MRFTKDHEWIALEDGVATTGITAYAAAQLGDIVFVELPAIGRVLEPGDGLAVVESVKAASEVYAPLAARVLEANAVLETHPELINQDPEGGAWIARLRLCDASQIEALMDRTAYDTWLEDR